MSRKFHWRNLPQIDDLSTSVMCLFDQALDSGLGGYRPIEAADFAGLGSTSGNLQSFSVALPSGVSTSGISFVSVYNSIPTVTIALVSPSGQPILAMSISDKTLSGFILNLSSSIPSTGYSADVISYL